METDLCITTNPADKVIRFRFSQPVSDLTMPPEQARSVGRMLMSQADMLEPFPLVQGGAVNMVNASKLYTTLDLVVRLTARLGVRSLQCRLMLIDDENDERIWGGDLKTAQGRPDHRVGRAQGPRSTRKHQADDRAARR